MRILGIETSCDETAAAVVDGTGAVLSSAIATSRDAFAQSGGVIPEEAAREQVRAILPVIDRALKEANVDPRTLDAVAVTRGPGLLGSLIIGTTTARILASRWGVTLVGVHHTLGHLLSTWLHPVAEPAPAVAFPVLTLSVSGGHTDLWLKTSRTEGTLLGRTRDDAAGEAFDKGAVLLGLPYPGGPAISKTGEAGDPKRFAFPLPLKGEPGYDWSFSGLKTALRYLIRDLTEAGHDIPSLLPDLAASYEAALCRHLAEQTGKALREHPAVKEVHLVGGVSANKRLRDVMKLAAAPAPVRTPFDIRSCTDNAAMIAYAAVALLEEQPGQARAPVVVSDALALEAAGR